MRTRGLVLSLLVTTVWIASCALTWAGPRWHFQKGLRLDTDWSGNVFLDDANSQRDFVIGIVPIFSLNRNAARSHTSISYRPVLRYYTQGTHPNRIDHRLNASSNVELVRDWFGLRANAGIGQQIVDRRQAFAGDTVANPNNITNTYNFSLNPYLLPQRLGRYAVLNVGLGFNLVNYSKSGANTSTGTIRDGRSRSVTVGLSSGPSFSRTHWSLTSRRSVEIYKDRNDNTFGNLQANAGYRLTRIWEARASLGYDQNDYLSNSRTSGTNWSLGLGWNPNRRVSGTFDFGRRYFGKDFGISIAYRHKRSSLSFNARRDISTSLQDAGRRIASPPSLAPLNAAATNGQEAQRPDETVGQDNVGGDQNGAGVPLQTVDSSSLDTGIADPTDQVFVVDSYTLSYNLSLRRSTLGLSAYRYLRDYQANAAEPVDTGVRLTLSRELTPKLSGSFKLGLTLHGNEPDPDLEYRQWAASLSFTRRLGADTSLIFGYRFTQRESDGSGGRNFSEDRLKLSLVNNGFFD